VKIAARQVPVVQVEMSIWSVEMSIWIERDLSKGTCRSKETCEGGLSSFDGSSIYQKQSIKETCKRDLEYVKRDL